VIVAGHRRRPASTDDLSLEVKTSNQEILWTVYSTRVARQDAINIVDRGGDYVVHAAIKVRPGMHATACARSMRFVVDMDSRMEPTCARCRRVLGLEAR
jgi:hypothetical protein